MYPDWASLAAAWAEVATPRADHARWQLCALAYAEAGWGLLALQTTAQAGLSLLAAWSPSFLAALGSFVATRTKILTGIPSLDDVLQRL